MSGERPHSPDPRDVDAEFARMLEGEGVSLQPGEAPREPAAPEPMDPWAEDSPEEEPGPPSAESIARARAAHPSAGAPSSAGARGGADAPRELDDDEVLYGDFEQPDPDLPTPSDAAIWAWTALLGGFALLLVVAVTPALPGPLGWLGGLSALGGLVALLLRAPRGRRDDGDTGAQV
ncbi:hypothetical protein [Brachybacterium saurashtrense]|uniref:DUF308 domain-containing protein n=1 Tax=Brachybacterium saurashtrense TaxID=556288 RepID=A0A345YM11_9MICO|nr:hypothetical protein [Brachybacterium saurashtrense]AXK44963.1 hypothetical protein DWV08_04615 [Brachybacterium saurashtrense]RRR21647.1 hypothetical protein DXU92_13190 [Brachybacterium saurashtrense]